MKEHCYDVCLYVDGEKIGSGGSMNIYNMRPLYSRKSDLIQLLPDEVTMKIKIEIEGQEDE